MSAAPHNPLPASTTARWIGLLIFLVGMGMLFWVFFAAKGLFDAPPPVVPPAGAAAPSAVSDLGAAFSQLVKKILLLVLMCIAGSVIASKGIQLFFAAQANPALPEKP